MSFMNQTLETPARPLWAYMYSMSFIDSRKGQHSGYLGKSLKAVSFIKDIADELKN